MAQRRKSGAAPRVITGAGRPKLHVAEQELKLDLGSGQRPREGFEPVDKNIDTRWRVDLWDGQKWPWADDSVDAFNACHVIEHIELGNRHETYSGQGNLFFFFFEEAFRCAKPGAVFHLQWPALQSRRAFMDPTHCRFIPVEALLYLDKNWRQMQGLDHYLGCCDWFMESNCSSMLTEHSKLPDIVQASRSAEDWNFLIDNSAVLKARKTPTTPTH